jgi:hypothetical protein
MSKTQITRQASVMADPKHGLKAIEGIEGVLAFNRFVPLIGLPTRVIDGSRDIEGPALTCTHGVRNGHITQDAAEGCALALAEQELMGLPEEVDLEAKLAAVAVTITTKPRFVGVKADGSQCEHVKFGHKTLGQARACVGQSQAKASQATKSLIKVIVASQSQPEASQSQPEASQPEAITEASQSFYAQGPAKKYQPHSGQLIPEVASQPEASQPATQKASQRQGQSRLKSGSTGQAGKA